MKFVVMGDIGKQILYHVGDEAMTEAAVAMLLRRDPEAEITLVATDPDVARQRYALPAVPRFGYLFDWARDRLETRLGEVSAQIPEGHHPLVDAVRAADAVIIAGGGNMNSRFAYQLYERVSLKRVAEHCGKPLFVTSQTIGPELLPRDAELLGEIIRYATCFGAREAASYALALSLGGTQGAVVHTLDDAAVLRPDDGDRAAAAALGLSSRYVVAGLTSHQGTTSLSDEDYADALTGTLDALARELDVDVAIAPHVGSFDPAERISDQMLAAELAGRSASGRLRPTPMLTARQQLALTAGAILGVSTRYHPTVFAPALGVPAVAVTTSYYSSVRMRGSMANVGLARYVVPAALWHDALPAMLEAAGRADLRQHVEAVLPARLAQQEAWWDAIVTAARTGRWGGAENLHALDQVQPAGEWSAEVEHVTPVADELGREKIHALFAAEDLRRATDEAARAKAQTASLRRELAAEHRLLNDALRERDAARAKLETVRGRKAIRLADAFTRLTRRALPRRR